MVVLLWAASALKLYAQELVVESSLDSAEVVLDYDLMLDEALREKGYGRAYFCYEILDSRDSLSEAALLNCADCLLSLGKQICSRWP